MQRLVLGGGQEAGSLRVVVDALMSFEVAPHCFARYFALRRTRSPCCHYLPRGIIDVGSSPDSTLFGHSHFANHDFPASHRNTSRQLSDRSRGLSCLMGPAV